MEQLPPGVLGVALAVFLYSSFCLACGIFFLWLFWVHDERKSYVAMLGFFVTLHTLASIAQQIHTMARWRSIKLAQHEKIVTHVGNPEMNITGRSLGADLVLFYIQYYSYNVESMLVFFWAVELVNSIFQLRFFKLYRLHASLIAKASAVVVPVVQILLLRFSSVKNSTVGTILLADAIMIGCFALGSLLLLAILGRYIHSRISLASFSVRYGRGTSGGTHGTPSGTGTNGMPRPRRRAIYDRWLVLRFTVGFFALGFFQLVVIGFQLRAVSLNNRANVPAEPDLSAGRARVDFALFAPAPTAVLFAFLVFGTTRNLREYMWNLLVPRAIRDWVEARARRKKEAQTAAATVSGVHISVVRDVEVAHGGASLGMQDFGAAGRGRDGDGKSDEYPIWDGRGVMQNPGRGGR
ncbi:hypothetical protein N658DRAFT_540594 [Parathielavia hyrcaniae]|uniref:Glycoside hydrolase n=1 Tax=Parathielavia hyrcaniae TaxID=113614 RepID=A0AAN6T051_9PEZI|nr:hypothetical protein N658DRAFT_540594 [Parathielavia hyrcaniae]